MGMETFNRFKLNYIGFGGTGRQVRDVLHIQDLCELILLQIQKLKKINNKLECWGRAEKLIKPHPTYKAFYTCNKK